MAKHSDQTQTQELPKHTTTECASQLATAALILAVVSLLIGWLTLGVVGAISIVFSYVSMRQTRDTPSYWMAKVAFVLSSIGLVLGLIVAMAVAFSPT